MPNLLPPSEILLRTRNKAASIRWNRSRFYRLCSVMQMTHAEVGALMGMERKDLRVCLRKGSFPYSVCLLLDQSEQYILSRLIGYKETVDPVGEKLLNQAAEAFAAFHHAEQQKQPKQKAS